MAGGDGHADGCRWSRVLDLTLTILNYLGTIVFGLSGGLTASRRGMDLFGFVIIAIATGTGGGMLRDLLLGVGPVTFIQNPAYLVVSAMSGVAAFYGTPVLEQLDVPRRGALVWADAVGLAVFAVAGTNTATDHHVPAVSAIVLGMLTAVGGGILRDLLSDTVPLILQKDLYATAAVTGTCAVIALDAIGLDPVIGSVTATLIGFGVRAFGILSDWSLPVYSPPGSDTGPRF